MLSSTTWNIDLQKFYFDYLFNDTLYPDTEGQAAASAAEARIMAVKILSEIAGDQIATAEDVKLTMVLRNETATIATLTLNISLQ